MLEKELSRKKVDFDQADFSMFKKEEQINTGMTLNKDVFGQAGWRMKNEGSTFYWTKEGDNRKIFWEPHKSKVISVETTEQDKSN